MSRKRRHKNRRSGDAGAETETVEIPVTAGDAEEDIEERDDEASADAQDEESGLEAVEPDVAESEPEPASENDAELERLATEARDMRALAQRKQAEFENFRKRIERERAETVKYASADVVKEMLPVLDNLERAVEAAKNSAEDEGQLREGVEIICKQFRDALFKLGLSEVEAEAAPFDPHVHEAVGRVETDEHPEGTVVEVLQKGYLYKDRLLRPSMVSVSLPASGASSQDEAHESEDEAVRQGE